MDFVRTVPLLSAWLREAFIKKEHVVAIFFNQEKAYETTWKQGILRDLHELGFRGRLPCFIRNFLADHLFQVKIGSTLSDFHVQENRVPQGSILSPVLFSIKINDIVTAVLKDSESSLFVDDFALCLGGISLPNVIRRLQLCVNSVNKWVQENGFKFSVSKTECIQFTNQGGVFTEPDIELDGTSIKVADEAKFLGLVFDHRLTFRAHVKYLKTVYNKALSMLSVVGHTDWGANRVALLRLYCALVCSKLDYGCIVRDVNLPLFGGIPLFIFTFRFFQNYFPLFLKNRTQKKKKIITDTATIASVRIASVNSR